MGESCCAASPSARRWPLLGSESGKVSLSTAPNSTPAKNGSSCSGGRTVKLSVVVPAYNERSSLPKTIAKIVRSLPAVAKEIIVVDDGSTDGTRNWLSDTIGEETRLAAVATDGALSISGGVNDADTIATTIKAIYHDHNQGKGAAVRTGFRAATGDIVVIQDADLEYDPSDWARFWPLFSEDIADVVFGSRFSSAPHRCLYYHHYIANKFISVMFSVLYNQTLSDLEVCYKMFRRSLLPILTLRCNDFGFEIEFSANIARQKTLRIYELGISYYGRTYAEGKKINWKDGARAIWYLFRFRFA